MINPCREVTVAMGIYAEVLKGGCIEVWQEGSSHVIEITYDGWISIYRYHKSLSELVFCCHYWNNGAYER